MKQKSNQQQKTLAGRPGFLTRKEFLRGVSLSAAGSVLLNPLIGRLHAEVEGRQQPTRFLFVLEGNGCPPNQVHPTNLTLTPMGERKQTVEERIDSNQGMYSVI